MNQPSEYNVPLDDIVGTLHIIRNRRLL
jgi:hypothetical protein